MEMMLSSKITHTRKLIMIIVILLVLAGGIYYFISKNREAKFTGLAVEDSFDISILIGDGQYEILTNVTKEEAMKNLRESERILEEIIENNLPFIFMNDTLLEAKRVFAQAEYAEILREEVDSSIAEKIEAKKALQLLDWEDIIYDDVIIYTNQIKQRRDKLFAIYDSLLSAKISLVKSEDLKISITGEVVLTEGVNESTGENIFLPDSLRYDGETKELFNEASIAFYEDREDAGDSLIELRQHLEAQRLEAARSNTLKNTLSGFVQRNWYFILLFGMILGVVMFLTYKNINSRVLKNDIQKMKSKRSAILRLIKKLQQERFKENKIPEVVYDVRLKKYKEKLSEIKEKLPVLESRLNKGEMNGRS
jgi:hypothetical protein